MHRNKLTWTVFGLYYNQIHDCQSDWEWEEERNQKNTSCQWQWNETHLIRKILIVCNKFGCSPHYLLFGGKNQRIYMLHNSHWTYEQMLARQSLKFDNPNWWAGIYSSAIFRYTVHQIGCYTHFSYRILFADK